LSPLIYLLQTTSPVPFYLSPSTPPAPPPSILLSPPLFFYPPNSLSPQLLYTNSNPINPYPNPNPPLTFVLPRPFSLLPPYSLISPPTPLLPPQFLTRTLTLTLLLPPSRLLPSFSILLTFFHIILCIRTLIRVLPSLLSSISRPILCTNYFSGPILSLTTYFVRPSSFHPPASPSQLSFTPSFVHEL
jgi:hypothetical protein